MILFYSMNLLYRLQITRSDDVKTNVKLSNISDSIVVFCEKKKNYIKQ